MSKQLGEVFTADELNALLPLWNLDQEFTMEMKATSKSKHWLLKYHLCRQNMSQGITLPLRVPTKDNNSDCGTKCQSAPDFTKLRKRLTGYAKSFTPPEWEPLPLPAWKPITELPNTIDDR